MKIDCELLRGICTSYMTLKFPIIGLAGFVGAGKTSAGQYLAERYNIPFINADEIVRELYEPGEEGYNLIISFYGKRFLINQHTKLSPLNKNKMRTFFLKNTSELKKLEQLIQPLVSKIIEERLKSYDLTKQPVCIEAIDFESDVFNLGTASPDVIVWIDVRLQNLWEHVKNQPGMTREIFNDFLKHQRRLKKIDYVIENNGSLNEFRLKLDEFIKVLS